MAISGKSEASIAATSERANSIGTGLLAVVSSLCALNNVCMFCKSYEIIMIVPLQKDTHNYLPLQLRPSESSL